MKLHHQIFLAMVLGGIAGALTEESTRLFGLPLLPGNTVSGSKRLF